jgi:hypothetical protein
MGCNYILVGSGNLKNNLNREKELGFVVPCLETSRD